MKFVSIPFDWVRHHTAGAVRLGISLESLLSRSLIEFEHGQHPEVISPVQRVLLCMNTTLDLDDATHGLARSGIGPHYTAIGLRMALGCSTLEGAILALSRLYAVASKAVRIQLRTEQEIATVSVHIDALDEADVAYIEENNLIWIFMQCLHFLGRAPSVYNVTLCDPQHFNIGMPHWGIGGRVIHGNVTSFSFPRRLLGEPPLRLAGVNVVEACQKSWLDFVGGSAAKTVPKSYVNEYGFVRFADMVRASGKSPNTLRRHLSSCDGNFRDARRRALVEAASDRLCASEDTVETIAAELGYSDASSFRRFLKSAVGLTPQQVRARRGVTESETDRRALQELHTLSARLNI